MLHTFCLHKHFTNSKCHFNVSSHYLNKTFNIFQQRSTLTISVLWCSLAEGLLYSAGRRDSADTSINNLQDCVFSVQRDFWPFQTANSFNTSCICDVLSPWANCPLFSTQTCRSLNQLIGALLPTTGLGLFSRWWSVDTLSYVYCTEAFLGEVSIKCGHTVFWHFLPPETHLPIVRYLVKMY